MDTALSTLSVFKSGAVLAPVYSHVSGIFYPLQSSEERFAASWSRLLLQKDVSLVVFSPDLGLHL